MHLSCVINCWGDPIDLCSSLSYCVVLSLSKVPGEVGSSPPVTACGPTPVSFRLGLFAVSVIPSACHGDVCCTAPVCHGIIGVSWDCSVQVLLAPFVGYMGLSQRDGLCACPCATFRHWPPCCVWRNHRLTTLASFRRCTAQHRDRPLWCLQNTRQTYGSITELGIIIISISYYHNETQGRKQTAAHGTKPARCSQLLYYQF